MLLLPSPPAVVTNHQRMDAQSTSHEELPVHRDENPSLSLLRLVIEGRQGRGAIAHRRRGSRGVALAVE
jgi:hypothetical protein